MWLLGMRVISNNVGLVKIITIIIIIINFFRLFRFILLLIDLTNLTLIHRKMLLIVLILHFLMIIAPSITAIDTPSSPILILWIHTQYEILTFLA